MTDLHPTGTEPTTTVAPKPPWYWLLAYRLLGRRLPPEYFAWMVEDATRPGWQLRTTVVKCAHSLIEVGALVAVFVLARGELGRFRWWVTGVGVLLLSFVPYELVRSYRRPVSARKELFDRQGIDASGRLLPPPPAGFAARADRLRTRLLPRPEFEAVSYAVVFALVLAGVAVFGLRSKQNAEPSIADRFRTEAKGCKDTDDETEAAVAGTLEDRKIARTRAYKYQGRLLVAASVDPTAPAGPLAVWILDEQDGGGYRVSVASYPKPGFSIDAPVVTVDQAEFSAEGDTLGKAVNNTVACFFKGLKRK